eukprot:14212811-Alexandrium_andersonii.AAC.1
MTVCSGSKRPSNTESISGCLRQSFASLDGGNIGPGEGVLQLWGPLPKRGRASGGRCARRGSVLASWPHRCA